MPNIGLTDKSEWGGIATRLMTALTIVRGGGVLTNTVNSNLTKH